MKQTRGGTIVFDRSNGSLTAPDFISRMRVRALQLSHKILAPIGYIGISRVHALLNKRADPNTHTVIREGAFEFQFPSSDYYWNRLLDSSWSYEPEIDFFLKEMADVPYVFLDLGANFGYWSTRVGSGIYGNHNTVCVEASEYCFSILKKNCEGKPVSLYHRAIDDTSGKALHLFGDRHAGFSIDNSWYGASTNKVNEVISISIDDLVAEEKIDDQSHPVIVKLDVEGVETRAIAGATRTIAGQSAFIVEDADREGPSEAVRQCMEQLGMSIFCVQGDRFVELLTLDDLRQLKARQSRIQATGLNLIATASPFWRDRLRGHIAPSSR